MIHNFICGLESVSPPSPQLLLSPFANDIGLLPIHAAPPAERLRLPPPLLRQPTLEIESSEYDMNTNMPVSGESHLWSHIPEAAPGPPAVPFANSLDSIDSTGLSQTQLPSADGFPTPVDQILETLEPPNEPMGDSGLSANEQAPKISAKYKIEKLKYLVDEINALYDWVDEQQRKSTTPQQWTKGLPPTVTPTTNSPLPHAASVRQKKTAASEVVSNQRRAVQSTVERNAGGDTAKAPLPVEPYTAKAPLPVELYTAKLSTVEHIVPSGDAEESTNPQIGENGLLVNGPIETLLKQNGIPLFPSGISIDGNAVSESRSNIKAGQYNLAQQAQNTTLLDAVFPGSNIPILSDAEVQNMDEMQHQAKKNIVHTNLGYSMTVLWPLAIMAPANSVFRTEATVLLANDHRPRLTYRHPVDKGIYKFRERFPSFRSLQLCRISYLVLNSSIPRLPVLHISDQPDPLVLFSFSNHKIAYPEITVSSNDSNCVVSTTLSSHLTKHDENTLRQLVRLDGANGALASHLVFLDGVNICLSAYPLKYRIPDVTSRIKCRLTAVLKSAHGSTATDKAGYPKLEWRWRSKKSPDIAQLLSDENKMTDEFSEDHKANKKRDEDAAEKSGAPVPTHPPTTFNETVDKLLQEAVKKGSHQIAEFEAVEEDEDILKRVAIIWLQKWWRIGQCIRDYSISCPLSWSETADGTCTPPPDYSGPCAAILLKNTTDITKETFAWSCNVDWPCIREPAIDLVNFPCPSRWENPGGQLCIAPDDYMGDCSPAMDFQGFTEQERSQWGSVCKAQWGSQQPTLSSQLSPVSVSSNLTLGQLMRRQTTVARNGPVNARTGHIIFAEPVDTVSGLPFELLS